MNRSPFKINNKCGYRIENKAEIPTIYLYDEIGRFGITADAFVKDFNAIDAKTIDIRVNSPGGSVFEGLTIFNAIRQHKATVNTFVDGLAASISSIIVLAGDTVTMAKNAFFMIHDPWSMVIGSSEDMRKEADLLDKVKGSLVQTYMDKSKKKKEEVEEWMKDETWMTAAEAKEHGFIDNIYEDTEEKAKATVFDLSIFSKVPERLAASAKKITAKEIEDALREVGCTQKQAKAIISEGFKPDQRDVADEPDQVDVEGDRRDAAPPVKKIVGTVESLLVRAEKLAPSKRQTTN